MRIWSIILMVLGIYLLAHAAYDEYSGTTHQPVILSRHRYYSAYLYRRVCRKDQTPDVFRRFMTTHWIYAGLIGGIGVALFITSQPSKNE